MRDVAAKKRALSRFLREAKWPQSVRAGRREMHERWCSAVCATSMYRAAVASDHVRDEIKGFILPQ